MNLYIASYFSLIESKAHNLTLSNDNSGPISCEAFVPIRYIAVVEIVKFIIGVFCLLKIFLLSQYFIFARLMNFSNFFNFFPQQYFSI